MKDIANDDQKKEGEEEGEKPKGQSISSLVS